MVAVLFLSGVFIVLLITAIWLLIRRRNTATLVIGTCVSLIVVALAIYLISVVDFRGVRITKPASDISAVSLPLPASDEAVKKEAKTLVNRRVIQSGPLPKSRPVHAVTKPSKKKPTLVSASNGVFYWRNFGRDPFAESRKEAMRKRAEAFRAMGLSRSCVAEAMLVTNAAGATSALQKGDRLAYMLSGEAGVHRNVVVDFARGIQAKTEEWILECNGTSYRLVLPEVCYNWSLAIGPGACVEIVFNAPVGGKVRWGVGSVNGPLPASDCNAQREGDGSWVAWYGECDWCEPAYGYISRYFKKTAFVPHKYHYDVTARRQTLRFSRGVLSRLVYVCLEYDGSHSCGVYTRPEDWKSSRVTIPDGMWRWEHCPS